MSQQPPQWQAQGYPPQPQPAPYPGQQPPQWQQPQPPQGGYPAHQPQWQQQQQQPPQWQQQQQQLPQWQQPQPPRKKRHPVRNTLITLIVLAVIAGLGVFGFNFYQKATGGAAGNNLIVNGNAEQGQCAADTSTVIKNITGWTAKGHLTPIQYKASGGDLTTTTPGPGDRGKCYFWGGPASTPDNPVTSMAQTINVADQSQKIDGGTLKYQLSAWLGGYSSQNDSALLTIVFLGTANKALGTASLGPLLAAARGGDTSELLLKQTSGTVPTGTRSVLVTLTMTRTDGSDNDGMADDLSLTFG